MRDVRPKEKYCTGCTTTKPSSEFYDKKRTKTKADGTVDSWVSLYAKCKRCTDAHNSRSAGKYKDYYRQYRKDNKQKIREKTLEYYLQNKNEWWRLLETVMPLRCECCGYDKHTAALDFHHHGDKKEGIHSMIGKKAPTPERWEAVKAELESCIILCANCHREHHAKYNFIDGGEKIVANLKKD